MRGILAKRPSFAAQNLGGAQRPRIEQISYEILYWGIVFCEAQARVHADSLGFCEAEARLHADSLGFCEAEARLHADSPGFCEVEARLHADSLGSAPRGFPRLLRG